MQTEMNDVRDIFLNGTPDAVTAILRAEHPADIADALQTFPPTTAWRYLTMATVRRQAEVFGYLDREFQKLLAAVTPRGPLASLVMEMNADDRADLYNEMSEDQREALMPSLAQAEREDVRRLASYKDGTAGAIMTSDYAALSPDLSATEALVVLRREAPNKETIYRTYVIDGDRKLLGSVRLQDLITAPPQAMVTDIMETATHPIPVDEDAERAVRKIAHYDAIALPVVDTAGCLVGIITHDDALDVIEAEATEDFHRVGTITGLARTMGAASIGMLYRARIFWLMLLVFGNIFSGAGIAHFEDTIAAHLSLMFFLPILIASGGNAGSQSATLMVRALATGDLGISDWGRVLGRELLVAVLLGLSMACAIAVIGVLRGGVEIALVIAMSMILIVIVGSMIGVLLPFILSQFNMDPATASTPLVTSIADVAGVLIYFSIAKNILGMT